MNLHLAQHVGRVTISSKTKKKYVSCYFIKLSLWAFFRNMSTFSARATRTQSMILRRYADTPISRYRLRLRRYADTPISKSVLAAPIRRYANISIGAYCANTPIRQYIFCQLRQWCANTPIRRYPDIGSHCADTPIRQHRYRCLLRRYATTPICISARTAPIRQYANILYRLT